MPPRLKSPTPLQHYMHEWRKHRKMTLQALADAIGATKGHLSKIETGTIALMPAAAEAIAGALNITADSLWNRAPSEGTSEEEELLAIFRAAVPDARKAMLNSVKNIADLVRAKE